MCTNAKTHGGLEGKAVSSLTRFSRGLNEGGPVDASHWTWRGRWRLMKGNDFCHRNLHISTGQLLCAEHGTFYILRSWCTFAKAERVMEVEVRQRYRIYIKLFNTHWILLLLSLLLFICPQHTHTHTQKIPSLQMGCWQGKENSHIQTQAGEYICVYFEMCTFSHYMCVTWMSAHLPRWYTNTHWPWVEESTGRGEAGGEPGRGKVRRERGWRT